MDRTYDHNIRISPVYQFANSDDETVRKNFIVRKTEFQTIISTLEETSDKDSLQHELILGRRGSGKSTLLKRIEVEINENPKLKEKYIPVNLAEEQAGIYRLFDLWEQVIIELSSRLKQKIKIEDYSDFANTQEYTRYLYDIIHEISIASTKKIVLLIDNFDRIIENFTDDGHLLRETLINYSDIILITASTRMDEHFWSYDKPFYEFFRKHRLESLSKEETFELLEFWSNSLEIPQIKNFINMYPGRVENIRLLTDGLPRTMRFFMEIIIHNEKPVDVDFLKKVMDEATPQYQERLNYLTPQLRKIILEMAFIWEACSTKQLVEKCRMESKLISANLKTLTAKGIVDIIPTGKKNNLYRISERFFNMWLIVTQGNPEQKKKARWLSIFLENWYDASELQELTLKHSGSSNERKLKRRRALLLSKGFCQGRGIPTYIRSRIIESAEQQTKLIIAEPSVEFSVKTTQRDGEKQKFTDTENYRKTPEPTDFIEEEIDVYRNFARSYTYDEKENIRNAEKYYRSVIKKGDNIALNDLANLYNEQGKFEDAEKYYLLAIEKGIDIASWNLTSMYYLNNRNREKARKYIEEYNGKNEFAIVKEIWCGIFIDVENRVFNALKTDHSDNADLITRLLIHNQNTLIYKAFTHPEFGKELQDKYKVLYYVCMILNNKQEDNILLRIPPELETPISDVLKTIDSLKEFYRE